MTVFQPIRDGDLPPYEAMESILPEYQYIFTEGDKRETSRTYRKEPGTQRTVVQPSQRTTVTVEPARYQHTTRSVSRKLKLFLYL